MQPNKCKSTHSMQTALAQAEKGNRPLFVGLAFSRNLGTNRNEFPPANGNVNINYAGKEDAENCFTKS